jgi:DNA repair exonuclease SbcCD ATPase subunit
MEVLKKYRKIINDKKAILYDLNKRAELLDIELKELDVQEKSIERALWILQEVSKQTQEQLEFRISELINLALFSTFPESYTFKINYEIKRNKTETRFYLVDNKGHRLDPLTSTGGGVVDIISFALRISLWSLSARKIRPIIILDEPFPFLDNSLQEDSSKLLKELAKKLQLQIIVVTHVQNLIEHGDKIFHFKKSKEGVTFLEKLKNDTNQHKKTFIKKSSINQI